MEKHGVRKERPRASEEPQSELLLAHSCFPFPDLPRLWGCLRQPAWKKQPAIQGLTRASFQGALRSPSCRGPCRGSTHGLHSLFPLALAWDVAPGSSPRCQFPPVRPHCPSSFLIQPSFREPASPPCALQSSRSVVNTTPSASNSFLDWFLHFLDSTETFSCWGYLLPLSLNISQSG